MGPGELCAQSVDSLAYMEQLLEDARQPDDLLSGREDDTHGPTPETSRKVRRHSGIGYVAWNADVAWSGRLAMRMVWSPHRWLELAGTVLRESEEPLRWRPAEQWLVGEHTSGYARLGGRVVRLVLGDFRYRSAAALSAFGLRVAEPPRAHPARSVIRMPDVRPYAGSSQQPAPRGLALSISPKNGVDIHLFTSARREDGALPPLSTMQAATDVTLRKSWRLFTEAGLLSRRQVLVTAHGASARLVLGRLQAGASWTRFASHGRTRAVLETAGHWQWRSGGPVSRSGLLTASFGYEPATQQRVAWSVQSAVPMSNLTLTLFHRHEWPEATGPWGPDVSLSPADHVRRTTLVSVATRHAPGPSVVLGAKYQSRVPTRPRESVVRHAATWIHAEHGTWRLELRVRHEQEPGTGTWNGHVRMSARMETSIGRRIHLRLHAVAARAGGLSARIQWGMSRRTNLTIGRSATWGRDSDPWSVLVTDRATGMLGLLRMTRPTAHASVRLDMEWLSAGRISLYMDQRVQRTTFTGTESIQRSLVLALRN
jgi:hypothetical protein